ncbi:hypothetical protein N9987_00400 [bacterium]|nr:hypothetical protein [bacterium]
MATINATISISSPDLTSSPINLNKMMTLTKAGTTTGLEQTSGIVRRQFTSTDQVNLVATGAQNYGTPTATTNANKIYIKNTGSSTTDYVLIGLGDAGGGTATTDNVNGDAMTIGRLYGGDWMLIPAHLATDVGDIWIAPSSSALVAVEFILFFE